MPARINLSLEQLEAFVAPTAALPDQREQPWQSVSSTIRRL